MAQGGLQGGVDPQVAAGFEAYLSNEPEFQETQSEEEVRPTKEAQAPVEEEQPETVEQTEETTEETVEQALSPDDEESTADEDYINTFVELAESFEVPIDEFSEHLQWNVGSDEEPNLISISDLADAYHNGPPLTEAARLQVEETRTEIRTESNKHMEQMSQLAARMISRIEQHRDPEIGWDRLREENLPEYVRLREGQQQDRADTEAALAAMEAETKRRTEEDKTNEKAWELEQGQRLLRLKPEWRKEKIGAQVASEVEAYMKSRFTPEQIANNRDAQAIITVWEAAQYVKSQSKKPALRKRLRKLPRKPLAATARDETAPARAQNQARQAVLAKFEKSGKIEDGLALFGEHIE